MQTIKISKGEFTLLYTFSSVGNNHGYSSNYVVLLGDEQHVTRSGAGSSNMGDAPSRDKLTELLDDEIKSFEARKKYE